MAVPSDGTVCGVCGGSGWTVNEFFAGDDEDFATEFEKEECGHCAGTGWEPSALLKADAETRRFLADAYWALFAEQMRKQT